jgi:tripartite-type tricarboxylate transporter receptor subunit TctC
MKYLIHLLAVGVLCAATAVSAKTYHLVVPFAAGNNADIVARAVAANYEQITKNKIVIENVPGGDTVVGVAHFKNNKKDILLGTATSEVFNPVIKKDLPYSDKDYEVAAYIGTNIGLWVTRADSDIRVPQDLLTKMPPVVGGYVTSFNYNLNSFVKERGIVSEIANYKGANQMLIDVVNGNLKLGLMAANSTMLQMVKENRLRIVGTAYHRDLIIDGIVMPSVSRALGITQYNGFVTLDLNITLPKSEREQLKKDLWQAVKMSQPTLESINIIPDMSNDSDLIQKRFDQYRQHIKKHAQ